MSVSHISGITAPYDDKLVFCDQSSSVEHTSPRRLALRVYLNPYERKFIIVTRYQRQQPGVVQSAVLIVASV